MIWIKKNKEIKIERCFYTQPEPAEQPDAPDDKTHSIILEAVAKGEDKITILGDSLTNYPLFNILFILLAFSFCFLFLALIGSLPTASQWVKLFRDIMFYYELNKFIWILSGLAFSSMFIHETRKKYHFLKCVRDRNYQICTSPERNPLFILGTLKLTVVPMEQDYVSFRIIVAGKKRPLMCIISLEVEQPDAPIQD